MLFLDAQLLGSNSFEQWEAEGCRNTTERALAFAKCQLAQYHQPFFDEATDVTLPDFIARHEREILGDGQ